MFEVTETAQTQKSLLGTPSTTVQWQAVTWSDAQDQYQTTVY